MNARCLEIFEECCTSKRTFRDYKNNLDYFLKFCHKDYDSLLLLPQIELERLLQDFTIFLKRWVENDNISPNSVPVFHSRDLLNFINKLRIKNFQDYKQE